MRKRKDIFTRSYAFFVLSLLASALLFFDALWVQFLGVSGAVVSFAFAAVSAFEYWLMFRQEQIRERANDELYREHYADNLRFNYTSVLSNLATTVSKMTREQLANITIITDIWDHWGEVQANDYYFSKALARAIIFDLSETKHGYTYLPSQHGLPNGSRIQKAVRAVTDELIRRDCAQRENNKDNGRAYLTVSQEDALDALYPEKGENE